MKILNKQRTVNMETLRHAYIYLLGRDENPVVDTDEIFPLYFLDNLQAGRLLVLCETFKFNDVLDPEKLHDGLVKLIQFGDWRKLGGRLRKKVKHKQTASIVRLLELTRSYA